jgi:signal transduction histidine kinase
MWILHSSRRVIQSSCRFVSQSASKLPLRMVLTVPFIFQILATVGAVGYFSFRNGQQTVSDLTSQLRRELTSRIEGKLKTYTEIPHAINRLNASAIAKGDLNVSNAKGEYMLWQQIQIFPAVSYVYCGDREGAFFGVRRLEADRSVQLRLSNVSTDRIFHAYSLDAQGNRFRLVGKGKKPFDPLVRPWYTSAFMEGQPTWSEIYADFSTSLSTITASVPVYNTADKSLLGVCATDFFLPQEMSQFLSSLKIGKTGSAFIIERSGLLVATSTQEPTIATNDTKFKRLPANESDNPTVRATASYLRDRFDNFKQIQVSQQLDFKIDNRLQLVQVSPFKDEYGLDWLIVTVLPEADFMEQIDTNTHTTVLLCIAALVTGVGICYLTARWITQPILHLNESAKALAKGEWAQTVEIDRSGDLGDLGKSFNHMAQQLTSYSRNLEQQVAERTAELQASQEQLRQVSIREERTRMAQEIHDTLAQSFTSIIVHLETALRRMDDPDTAATHLKTGRDLARAGLAEARRSVGALRPQLLEHCDLYAALDRLANQLFTDTDISVTCHMVGEAYPLSSEVEDNLLRIGQEALMNAFKHSIATKIEIELIYESDRCSLRIKDNGQGFDTVNLSVGDRFGLLGMTERAKRIGAQLTIQSQIGEGTEVRVVVGVIA